MQVKLYKWLYSLSMNLPFSHRVHGGRLGKCIYIVSNLKKPVYSSPFNSRSSHPEMFLGKGVQKICRKFTGKHPCDFNKVALHIFRTHFSENTSGRLLL